MRRMVIDTSLYIDWLNARRHEALLFERGSVKYLSAVVLLELLAGAFSQRDRKLVGGIAGAFEKAGRLLLPPAAVYAEAGHVLRALQASFDYDLPGKHSLVGDVLIALSARSIGATVITQNERDFVAIQRVRRFKLAVAA